MSFSEFVRLPAVAGLRRVKAPAIAASARAAPPSPSPVPVLRLACTLTDDQVAGLVPGVIARLAGSQWAGTVVLELGSGADLDHNARQALCGLRSLLERRGADLRLVITSREARDALATAAEHRLGPDAVHDCARAAMLAAYARVPGPGLVDGVMRAALAAPPDAL